MTGRFPIAADRIVATLTGLFRAQGQQQLADVLGAAAASIDETDYDNLDGGTIFYTLGLELPVTEYAKVEPRLHDVEAAIEAKLGSATRKTGRQVLRWAVITPAFEVLGASAVADAPEDAVLRLWDEGAFRLFLSHVSAHKAAVKDLKTALRIYGVSGFLAHEDIEPTLEWQAEIHFALQSMHAMAALVTPDFHQSWWTDQEVGIAMGRGVLVVPVQLPVTPYGFMAKHQGLPGDLASPAALASAIVGILFRQARTVEPMREALVMALESSNSYAGSRAITSKIEAAGPFTLDQVARIEGAIAHNNQVSDSSGVPARLRRVIDRNLVGTG